MCTKNHNCKMYSSWDIKWKGYISCYFALFFALLCPWQTEKSKFRENEKTTEKKNVHEKNVITLHMCTKNYNHMMHASSGMKCDIFGSFFPFYPINNPEN